MADNRHLFAGDSGPLSVAALKAFFASSHRSCLDFIGELTHVIGFQLAVALSSTQLRKHYSSFGIRRQLAAFSVESLLM
jgi:hypothetical protein